MTTSFVYFKILKINYMPVDETLCGKSDTIKIEDEVLSNVFEQESLSMDTVEKGIR